jgi:hypothetical protein
MNDINTLDEFKKWYQDKIEVLLNWNKLKDEVIQIKTVEIEIKTIGNNVFTPWYVRDDLTPCDYWEPSAIPQSIVDVAKNKELMSFHNFDKTLRNEEPSTFPAYYLGNEKYLLLDGNHRTVTSYLKDEAESILHIDVLFCRIHNSILPDLKHWE